MDDAQSVEVGNPAGTIAVGHAGGFHTQRMSRLSHNDQQRLEKLSIPGFHDVHWASGQEKVCKRTLEIARTRWMERDLL